MTKKSAYNREWRKKNPEKLKEYYRKRQATPERKEYDRIRAYKRKYGISRERFLEMRAAQGGRCAICQRHESEKITRWGTFCVDHSHANGSVRGLLCAQCNKGLGSFRDSPNLLLAAVDYLASNQ